MPKVTWQAACAVSLVRPAAVRDADACSCLVIMNQLADVIRPRGGGQGNVQPLVPTSHPLSGKDRRPTHTAVMRMLGVWMSQMLHMHAGPAWVSAILRGLVLPEVLAPLSMRFPTGIKALGLRGRQGSPQGPLQ